MLPSTNQEPSNVYIPRRPFVMEKWTTNWKPDDLWNSDTVPQKVDDHQKSWRFIVTSPRSNPIQSLFNRSDPQPAIRLLHIGNQLFWRSGLQALPGKEVRPWRTIRCELGMPFFSNYSTSKNSISSQGPPLCRHPQTLKSTAFGKAPSNGLWFGWHKLLGDTVVKHDLHVQWSLRRSMSYEHMDWVGIPPAHLQVESSSLALVKFAYATIIAATKRCYRINKYQDINIIVNHCCLLHLVAIIFSWATLCGQACGILVWSGSHRTPFSKIGLPMLRIHPYHSEALDKERNSQYSQGYSYWNRGQTKFVAWRS